MAESAFADVPGDRGLGTLVFISFDQTFQTPPPTSHMDVQAQPHRVQRVSLWLERPPPSRQPAGRAWGHLSGRTLSTVGLLEPGLALRSE